MYSTPMMFPDGRVMVLDQSYQWVEVRPAVAAPPTAFTQPIQQQQKLFRARATSQPPVSQASIVSESVAEEVLAQPSEPEVAESEPELAESEPELAESEPEQAESEPELAESQSETAESEPSLATPATKARASCPVAEEEVSNMSSPKMYFLSSQDHPEYADSESGMSSHVDLSSEKDFIPLKELAPRASTTKVQKWIVARRVQVRTGPSAASENVCVLNPGSRVQVVKTKTSRTKAGFVITKAYVISSNGQQGWVSVNRQHKKTDEKFVFRGQAEEGFQKLVKLEDVWERHDATVEEIEKASANTFTIRVTCPTWKQMEALRKDLKKMRLHGRSLINRKTPELINLKRVFGKKPMVHVYDIDTDVDNSHREFKEAYDWSCQFRGASFEDQVKEDLKELNFRGIRRVNWSAGYRARYRNFYMQDFCSVEFNSDPQLRNFLKKFENFEFFKGAKVTVDPSYANLATIPTSSIIESL